MISLFQSEPIEAIACLINDIKNNNLAAYDWMLERFIRQDYDHAFMETLSYRNKIDPAGTALMYPSLMYKILYVKALRCFDAFYTYHYRDFNAAQHNSIETICKTVIGETRILPYDFELIVKDLKKCHSYKDRVFVPEVVAADIADRPPHDYQTGAWPIPKIE